VLPGDQPGAWWESKRDGLCRPFFSWSAAISQPLYPVTALFSAFSVILKIDAISAAAPGDPVKLSLKSFSLSMTQVVLVAVPFLLAASPVLAQDAIYRCGNEYINDASVAKQRGCKLMQGGNITIIQGTKPQQTNNSAPKASSSSSAGSPSRSSGSRIDTADQRSRDSDARAILDAELKKAQDRLDQAKKAYANGEPEKEGIEGRNHQRYLDRVAELKAAKERAESDVNSISRELGRLGPAKSGSAEAQ
jgi:hypothetical protein